MNEDEVTKHTGSEDFGINVAIAADPVLAKHAAEIRRLGKRLIEDAIKIGRHLAKARDHVGHGAWLTWIKAEFGWSDQTARRFIHVYEFNRDSKFNKLLNLDLPLSCIYQLAAPKTPEEACKEITERIEAGEKPTVAEVTDSIARAKQAVNGTATAAISDNTANATAADDSAEQRKAANARLFSKSAEPVALAATRKSVPLMESYLAKVFAQLSGSHIYARIPLDRRAEVCAGFLDALTVEEMLKVMSTAFGQALCDRVPAAAEERCPLKRHHPPVNILGGYRFPDPPQIDLGSSISESPITRRSPAPSAAGDLTIPDDLSIPAFLRRTDKPTE
jgi:hypothetical protein